MSKERSSFRMAMSALLFALIAVLLLLEVGIRTRDAFGGYGFFSSHRNALKSDYSPMRPFRTFGFDLYKEVEGERFIRDRYGKLFPFAKEDGVFRIVCFGGSTTENLPAWRSDSTHYPLQLGETLREVNGRRIEVINLGYSAYATPHSLILLELDVLSWDADLVILSHNFNDLLAAWWPGFVPDYSNKYSYPLYGMPDYGSRFTVPSVLFQHSQLYWFVKRRVDKMLASREVFELRRASIGEEPLAEAASVFERNLRSFSVLAAANGVKVLLGNQAREDSEEMFLEHMRFKPFNEFLLYPRHEEYLRHHHRYNEIIRSVAGETGALFADNHRSLAGRREHFRDFVHYTPLGITALARNYAKTILESGVMD
ncbi:MAG: SGNH/GDSL hydrolase family protein [Candidatus Krumholzibacteria bacterium]|nr:SGNH/GDSL hydrolase family protein [Candidatus Krumholzibacteria bacterium]MDP6668890.1 SGNH/GDSL hydrolase family protein [Candidatus Krumholzibacteria bacterium]MDP6796721.1 SGNH/GDSL hydrolase family protein [Candidatus Krumholzibacteria bacterium]MDP7022576.1 SGNH/GDSL hydrolase family protein [Candidatus Krumholzibacteria bacterium]